MKRHFIAVAVATMLPLVASAHESFFEVEIGLGAAHTKDIGDGTWTQYHEPINHEGLNSPAYLFGLTGQVVARHKWDLRYHLDYVYIGGISASCRCVSDADYGAHNYSGQTSKFNGFGHTQGVSLTLEPGYTFSNGIRLAVEAGPWVFWNTWHETADIPGGLQHVRHEPKAQFSWVAGTSVSYKNWRLAYRYYKQPQTWNPYPALQGGAHMLFITHQGNVF